ncbi:acetylornithine deacetylase [Nocardia transvalensis]|uniref:Acetylornithine deacetylase n=1 Tax=Nocardia transvalensis TaxID=37333 RepID=A0A7W9UJ33_9NOCA|nr:M20/M25/M40 family metallo-hydrolase [Nocardia transvalensis]MBB5914325.1 acetylornithine deacetylase [Nocardia transvalensis]
MTDRVAEFIARLDTLLPESELVELAAGLAAIPSPTGGETELAVHIRDLLERNGIRSELHEVSAGRQQTVGWVGPAEGKPGLLLNGHLDIDPLVLGHPDDPYRARRVGDKLYGAGLHNMKSGLAAILAAAMAVRRSEIELNKPLLLEFVVGELQGGLGTREALRRGLTAEAAVVPEPYSVRRVITRTAGVYKFAVVVRGVSAHTSRSHEGVDALAVLRGVCDLLEDNRLRLPDGAALYSDDFPTLPRLQIASMVAGRGEAHDLSGVSYCADKATALVDLRYPPPFEPADVADALRDVLSQATARYPRAHIAFDHPPDPVFGVGGTDMPPMDVPGDSAIVADVSKLLTEVSEFTVEETGLALPYSYCGNDTTHLSRAGIECCLFGPRGAGADTEHHVLVSEMSACARTLAALAVLRCG